MYSKSETWRELEEHIKAFVERGDLESATTRFLEHFGGDILAFLAMRHGDDSSASEVFSVFCEDFWRGLPSFRWRSTIRSWGYTLARNASNRYFRSGQYRSGDLPPASRIPDPAARTRSSTAMHLRSEVKSRIRELRCQLPVDEQSLLVLRIDKGLSWNELAVVLATDGETLSHEELRRQAARLRQRFVTIKRHLRALAEAEGLI